MLRPELSVRGASVHLRGIPVLVGICLLGACAVPVRQTTYFPTAMARVTEADARRADSVTEVDALFGSPAVSADDGRYRLYLLDARVAWVAAGEGRDQDGFTSRMVTVFNLFEFDDMGQVVNRVVHRCDEPAEAVCSMGPDAALSELIREHTEQ